MIKVAHSVWVGGPIGSMYLDGVRHNLAELGKYSWEYRLWVDDKSNIPEDLHHICRIIPTTWIEEAHKCEGVQGSPVLLSDLIRLRVLFEFGGLYMDCDEFLLADPESFINSYATNFMQEARRVVTNNIMYATAGSTHIRGVYEEAISSTEGWACTGPVAVIKYLSAKLEGVPSLQKCTQGYYLAEDMDTNIPGISIISDKTYPFKFTKYATLINQGKVFSTDEYRSKGYKLMSMSASSNYRLPEEYVVKIESNNGYNEHKMIRR